jgi:hypothetical protein
MKKKWAYKMVIQTSEPAFEKKLNELGELGWEVAEFQTLYDPDRGTSYIAVMKMALDQ